MTAERVAEPATVHDLPTAQSLVRLRLLTEDAARRVDDISEAGRHQALIALDGACEYALWLAVRQAGVRLKRDQRAGVPTLHRAVAEQRPVWALLGWPGVNQMHEARNAAQHAGVAPDREQLPAWRDAALAFIDSLCVAAFNSPVADIVLASAVRDPELRVMLTHAERTVDDTRQSFSASAMAFNVARGRWRVQRLSALAVPSPGGYEPILASEEAFVINELTGAVRGLEDVLEVQPFAGDLSEYVWFRRALGERASSGWTPTAEDARRALVFVAGWRWEIFTLGYHDDRWEAHREGIEPPRVGDGATITITGAQADLIPEASAQPARTVLFLQLANVPGRGRPPWDAVLLQAITDGMRGIRTAQDEAAFLQAHWYYSGVLSVRLKLGADAASVIDVLDRAVADASTRYAEHAVESAVKERKREELEKWLRGLFTCASEELTIFGEPSVVRDEWIGTLGLLAFIPVRANMASGDPLESHYGLTP